MRGKILAALVTCGLSASLTHAAILFNHGPDSTESHRASISPAPSDFDAPHPFLHSADRIADHSHIDCSSIIDAPSSEYDTDGPPVAATAAPFATDSSPPDPDPYTSGLLGLPPCGVALIPENDFAPAAVIPFISHPTVPEPSSAALLAIGTLSCLTRRRSPHAT